MGCGGVEAGETSGRSDTKGGGAGGALQRGEQASGQEGGDDSGENMLVQSLSLSLLLSLTRLALTISRSVSLQHTGHNQTHVFVRRELRPKGVGPATGHEGGPHHEVVRAHKPGAKALGNVEAKPVKGVRAQQDLRHRVHLTPHSWAQARARRRRAARRSLGGHWKWSSSAWGAEIQAESLASRIAFVL
jgi:hypothetical protein